MCENVLKMCLRNIWMAPLDLPEEEKRRLKLEKGENIDPNKEFMKMTGLSSQDMQQKGHDFNASSRSRVHLSPLELKGIKYAVMYLHHLPASKKNVPLMLPDPIAVIKDIRQLVLGKHDFLKLATPICGGSFWVSFWDDFRDDFLENCVRLLWRTQRNLG